MGGARVIGLPGNPASAIVTATLFVRPLIRALLGLDASRLFARARLAALLGANGGRETYLRAETSLGEKGQLIAAVAAELQRNGSTALMLWVLEKNPARALYKRLGGQVLGQKDWDGNEAFGMQVKEVAYGWPNIHTLAAPAQTTSIDF